MKQNGDINYDKSYILTARKFCTKIWNLFNFFKINNVQLIKEIKKEDIKMPSEYWMLYELNKLQSSINLSISHFEINNLANEMNDFIFKKYCDK